MDGLLCHCRIVDPDGHEPGSVFDCDSAPAKPARVKPFRDATTGTAAQGHGLAATLRPYSVRGTCPDCGQRAQVKRVKTCGLNPATGKQVAPGMVPHVIGLADPCPGAGKPPTETRYTPVREPGA